MLLNNWKFKYFLDIQVLVDNLALPTLYDVHESNNMGEQGKLLHAFKLHFKSLT
jgi:hypothetical protein